MEETKSQVSRKLYTIKEAVEALNLSDSMVRRMIKRQELKIKRFGRSVRIPASEVERLVNPEANSGS